MMLAQMRSSYRIGSESQGQNIGGLGHCKNKASRPAAVIGWTVRLRDCTFRQHRFPPPFGIIPALASLTSRDEGGKGDDVRRDACIAHAALQVLHRRPSPRLACRALPGPASLPRFMNWPTCWLRGSHRPSGIPVHLETAHLRSIGKTLNPAMLHVDQSHKEKLQVDTLLISTCCANGGVEARKVCRQTGAGQAVEQFQGSRRREHAHDAGQHMRVPRWVFVGIQPIEHGDRPALRAKRLEARQQPTRKHQVITPRLALPSLDGNAAMTQECLCQALIPID